MRLGCAFLPGQCIPIGIGLKSYQPCQHRMVLTTGERCTGTVEGLMHAHLVPTLARCSMHATAMSQEGNDTKKLNLIQESRRLFCCCCCLCCCLCCCFVCDQALVGNQQFTGTQMKLSQCWQAACDTEATPVAGLFTCNNNDLQQRWPVASNMFDLFDSITCLNSNAALTLHLADSTWI